MKIFLDVGAHVGETARIALEDKYRFDKIYCFEPVLESCNQIRNLGSEKIEVCEYGLWSETCIKDLYSPINKGFHSASVYIDRFPQAYQQKVKMIRASQWFKKNLNSSDKVYLKLNCEGAEYEILKDLVESGEHKKIDVLMVDFDVRKIPSQKHLMEDMKAKLKKLNIPSVFYIDEYNLGKGTHDYFTHLWLDESGKNNSKQSKIIEGLKLKGRPVEIPDCSRDDLPQFFVDMGFRVGVEIGVDKGEFSEKFAKAGLSLFAVDPWKSYDDYTDSRGQARLDFLYEHTKRVLAPYPNTRVIRKNSMEAVNDFANESLDFVYIDGNHQLKYVIEDLIEWTKKVRKGGIIAGHDYIYTNPKTQAGICHVIYALQAFTNAYKVGDWYLLGRKERKENEVRDRFRSWMFFKPDYEIPVY